MRIKQTTNTFSAITSGWPLLLILCLVFTVQVSAQDAKALFNSAKKALQEGNPDDCLNYLKNAQAALGGSNARIESIKCQALAEKSDWIGAGIAYKNFDSLIAPGARQGEAYTYMVDLKKTIWSQLAEMKKKREEEKEKEIKQDLSLATAAESQHITESEKQVQQYKKESEARFFDKAMATKDSSLMAKYVANMGDAATHLIEVQTELDKIKHPGKYIIQAVKNRNVPELRYLVKLGADKNTKDVNGLSLLHLAILNKDNAMVDALLSFQVNIEEKTAEGETALLLSVKKNYKYGLLSLLAKKADPNVSDRIGNPAFLICLIDNLTDFIRPLVINGVDINHPINIDGVEETPLYYSVYTKRNLEMASVLLENGADINAYSNTNWTPLMAAVYRKDDEMVQFLLTHKADVNKAGPSLWTPLHFAVRSRNPVIIRALISNGANQYAKDQWGRIPIKIARERRYEDILNLFKKL